MPEDQIAALIGGPIAAAWGMGFILLREPISRAARAQRERRGMKLTPSTQSPRVIAIGGAAFVVFGILVFVSGITKALA